MSDLAGGHALGPKRASKLSSGYGATATSIGNAVGFGTSSNVPRALLADRPDVEVCCQSGLRHFASQGLFHGNETA